MTNKSRVQKLANIEYREVMTMMCKLSKPFTPSTMQAYFLGQSGEALEMQ
jgi:hypothetical protein